MEIVAAKREGSNVLEAECSKVPRVEDQIDVRTSKELTKRLPKVMYGTVPSSLMEVFSVRFLNFDHTKFSEMYGCILISAHPTYIVFTRKRGEPLNIDSKGFIKLQDPYRVIEPLDPISIYPILFRYEARIDQFEYNDSRRIWTDRFCNEHDSVEVTTVESLFGEIEVTHAVYRYGVVAHVDVTLTGCRFPSAITVHGLITAENSKLGEKGKSILFDDDGKGISIDVSSCKDLIVQLPLSRCKTAVPVSSSLIIGVINVGTPDQTIAENEKLEFVAMLNGREVKTLRGAACQVNVGVTWSHYKA